MCDFFSFVTEPDTYPNERFYFNWQQRQMDFEGADSHDHIISFYKLDDGKCNGYEYNPLTKKFIVDKQNSQIDDSVQAEEWVEKLDFKKIVEPLIIKPIVNPFELPKVKRVTQKQKQLLIEWIPVWDSVWSSVGSSVRDSVWSSVWSSVGSSVRDSVWSSVGLSVGSSVGSSVRDSVWSSVWSSVGDSVWDSVGAYISSFFDIEYGYDFTPAIKLWEAGLVPSFDGTTWRLHSGEGADVVYELLEAN